MTESSETPEASSTTSEADADNSTPTAAPDDATIAGVSDEQLPEDLQPGEDNPLAEPLDPDAEETRDAEELGLDDTQEETSGTYRTEGELGDADTTTADSPESEDTDSEGDDSAG